MDISSVNTVISKAEKRLSDADYFKNNKEKVFEEDVRLLFSDLGTLSVHIPEDSKKNLVLPDTLFFTGTNDELSKYDTFFVEFKRNSRGRKSPIQTVTFDIFFGNIRTKCYMCYNWVDFINIIKDLYNIT